MLAFARREPSAILLGAQLAGVLLYPFMEGNGAGRALFSLFGIAILGLVVMAVRSSPGLTWIVLLFAAKHFDATRACLGVFFVAASAAIPPAMSAAVVAATIMIFILDLMLTKIFVSQAAS